MAAEPQIHSLAGERLAYRPAELAALVGLSAKAIYRAIGRGELRAARIANGSRLLIPAEEAERWLVANPVVPKGNPNARHSLPGRATRRPLAEALSRFEDAEDED
jgi:excisionase family DNA binding protein